MQWLRHTSGGIVTTECVRENKREEAKTCCHDGHDRIRDPARRSGSGMPELSSAEELLYDPDVVIVMKDKAFHVIKGAQQGTLYQIQPFPYKREGPRHPAPQ